MGFGSGGKANGMYQSSSAVMAAAKKPNMQLVQADHELFLQAFESEFLLSSSCIFRDISLRVILRSQEALYRPWGCIAGETDHFTGVEFDLVSILKLSRTSQY